MRKIVSVPWFEQYIIEADEYRYALLEDTVIWSYLNVADLPLTLKRQVLREFNKHPKDTQAIFCECLINGEFAITVIDKNLVTNLIGE